MGRKIYGCFKKMSYVIILIKTKLKFSTPFFNNTRNVKNNTIFNNTSC